MTPDVRVILVGDSFVAGVGDPEGLGWVGRVVAAAFAAGVPLTAYNLGVRRNTTADVQARWHTEVAARLTDDADCRLVVSVGSNDANHEHGRPRVEPADSVENLSRTLAGARRLELPVLLVGPAPANDGAQQERVSTLSTEFRDLAERHGVPYVDIAGPLTESELWKRELAAGDGAHPGSDGYALLAGLIRPTWLKWLSAA